MVNERAGCRLPKEGDKSVYSSLIYSVFRQNMYSGKRDWKMMRVILKLDENDQSLVL